MSGKRIPITNVGVGYVAEIRVGSHGSAANVILDTGSSALAVTHAAYKPQQDAAIKPTDLAQDIIYYRGGGWVGPMVSTVLAMGGIELPGGMLTIALDEEPHTFGSADGILGLAYDNHSYDLSAYLRHHGTAASYPWPFPARTSIAAIKHLSKLFKAMPKKALTPFFTQLVDAGKAANKFAFYTRRSTPNAKRHAENAGYFVLGGGEEHADLHQGAFATVQVVHDKHYNTTLKAVQVGAAAPVPAHSHPRHFEKKLISNSIIDSGSEILALATDVFKAIMGGLDPGLARIAERAVETRGGIPNAEVELARWPHITFILAGEHGRDVPIVCAPETYWQLDAGEPGRSLFRISGDGHAQSILGLPLLNNHYVVFDRSVHRNGVVRFAKIK